MALNSNALITEAEYELIIGTSVDTSAAEMQINIASQLIEKIANRKFIEQSYTEQAYDGNGEQYLYIKNFPINSSEDITVEEWDTVNNVSLVTLTENLDYIVYHEEGMIAKRGFFPNHGGHYDTSSGFFDNGGVHNDGYLHQGGQWAFGRKRWRVSYTAGYLITTVPFDLKSACATVANLVRVNKGNLLKASERIGNYSYNNVAPGSNLGIPIPLEVYNVIKLYRKDIVGV